MITKLLQATSPIYGAPYGIIVPVAPGIKAANFEGVWAPISGAKLATLELYGSMSTLSLQLYGTNDPLIAGDNAYTITIGGTITNGDTLTATFANASLPIGSEAVTIPVVTADTTTTLATKLAAAINADANLLALGFSATSAAAVVTVSFPSFAPGSGAAGNGVQANANLTQITISTTGSSTETGTVATTTTGTALGSAIAAFGLTALTVLPAFIKARVTTLTGTNAIINGNLSAAI